MIVTTATLQCDQCGVSTGVTLHNGHVQQPDGWRALRFVPGVLLNKSPRPDTHFCSDACRALYKTALEADLVSKADPS